MYLQASGLPRQALVEFQVNLGTVAEEDTTIEYRDIGRGRECRAGSTSRVICFGQGGIWASAELTPDLAQIIAELPSSTLYMRIYHSVDRGSAVYRRDCLLMTSI